LDRDDAEHHHGQHVVTAAATTPTSAAPAQSTGRTSPFLGLVPYSLDDADYFFGRDEWRASITDSLLAYRVSILYGASGIGKSSVLQAGVLHELRETARENHAKYGAPEFAVAAHRRWTDDPRVGLKQSIVEAVEAAAPNLATDPPEGTLAEVLDAWGKRLGGRVLVVLDQFEEYFVYHRADRDTGFAAELAEALTRRDIVANFLISIREDALASLDVFKREVPGLLNNLIRIEHLTAGDARNVIDEAVKRWNEDRGENVEVDDDLVTAVLQGVRSGRVFVGETGQGIAADGHDADDETAPIEAPYLQLVMTRLWDEMAGSHELRLETLTRLGGVQEIVETHLDETMDRLPKDQQDVAARVFNYLVTPSGSKIAHSVVDLAKYANVDTRRLEPVLVRLAEPDVRVLRRVRPEREGGVERYEIFHDVLAAAVLDWRSRYSRFGTARKVGAWTWALLFQSSLIVAPVLFLGAAAETHGAVQAVLIVWCVFATVWWILGFVLLGRTRRDRPGRIMTAPLKCLVAILLGPIAVPALGIAWLVRRRRLRRTARGPSLRRAKAA
jgi:Novel STAND NTPase 1